MSYLRPSSDADLVSPVIACLVAVYGAEFGRGACAEIEPPERLLHPREQRLYRRGVADVGGYCQRIAGRGAGLGDCLFQRFPAPSRERDAITVL